MGGRSSCPPEAPSSQGPSEARAGGQGGASARTRTLGARGWHVPQRRRRQRALGGLALVASWGGSSTRAVGCSPGDWATQNWERQLLEPPVSPDPGLLPHARGMALLEHSGSCWACLGTRALGGLGRQTTLLPMASNGHTEGPPSGNLVKNFLEKQTGSGCQRLEPGFLLGSGHLHQVQGREQPTPADSRKSPHLERGAEWTPAVPSPARHTAGAEMIHKGPAAPAWALATEAAIRFNGTEPCLTPPSPRAHPASLLQAAAGRRGRAAEEVGGGGPGGAVTSAQPIRGRPAEGCGVEPETSPAPCPPPTPPRRSPRASAGPSPSWTPSRPRPSW